MNAAANKLKAHGDCRKTHFLMMQTAEK